MNKFKLTMIIIIIAFGFIKNSSASPKSSGLYLTFNDFVNHKLSYVSDPSGTQNNKIIYHEFLGGGKVTVVNNGKKLVLSKDQVFGYSNGNQDYRFYGNKAYRIVDTNGFYLYSADKLVQQTKGMKPVKTFYFSTKADNELLTLTQENINKAFAANHKFRYLVQAQFRSDEDLDQYDGAVNEYKIKEIFTDSSK